jgi:hypothetical protein
MAKKEVRFTKRPATMPAAPDAAEAWINAPRGNDVQPLAVAPALPEEPTKRLTLDIPESLHARVKSQCAKRGKKMIDEIRILLETHFPPEAG